MLWYSCAWLAASIGLPSHARSFLAETLGKVNERGFRLYDGLGTGYHKGEGRAVRRPPLYGVLQHARGTGALLPLDGPGRSAQA